MEEILQKILIVGDSGVGKSCIQSRFTNETFEDDHSPTIGVEFATKTITINNNKVKLQIWDTAGQEGFRSITRSFYRNADGVLLVYNIKDRTSFDNCKFWLNEIRQNSTLDVLIYLIGNQLDLDETGHRSVVFQEGEVFARKNGLNRFKEISAKTGKGVDEVFNEFSNVLYNKWKDLHKDDVIAAKIEVKPMIVRKRRWC